MTLFNPATSGSSESADTVLGVLAEATHGRSIAAKRRIVASIDRYNPDEGLALLDAYVNIADPSVRQAILDLVLLVSDTNPYSRTQVLIRRGTVKS